MLNNLGLCHWDLGNLDSARWYMLRAVDFYREMDERYLDDIATSYCNIAQVFNSAGDHQSALAYLDRSEKLMLSHFGPQFSDLLLPIATRTEVLLNQNRLHEAEVTIARGIDFLRDLGWSVTDPVGDYFLSDALIEVFGE